MAEEEEDPNVVCEEFNRLSFRSSELFSALRDLPRFGVKQWQSQFIKTFDIYTKLWKFQQDKRSILEEHASLKRNQIGEIASKVGQLYYHYYLHTSEVKYLLESLQFYSAIASRGYFSQQLTEFDMSMSVKNLRYLARFFVVALLVRDYTILDDVLQKLGAESSNVALMQTDEKNLEDWTSVVKEAKSFIACENFLSIIKQHQTTSIKLRLKYETNVEMYKGVELTLQSAVVVGGCDKQAKFSEMTIDMYRMLLALEYEIGERSNQDVALKNPGKYLLYKPTFQQFYAYLAAVFKDLQENKALMIYISGDSQDTNDQVLTNEEPYYSGISTVTASMPNALKAKQSNNPFLIYPEDLVPFTRKPLFIVVDSNNSQVFQTLKSSFNQPLVCIMSPTTIADMSRKRGSCFTTFLLDPLLGLCQLCQISQLPEVDWKRCKEISRKISSQCLQKLHEECSGESSDILPFLSDAFLKRIITNYVITWIIIRMCKKTEDLPSFKPDLPRDVLENKVFFRQVWEIVMLLGVKSMFYEVFEIPPVRI